MAITVTPKYKPFTYEELVKPLEGYWKKYDEAEEKLNALQNDVEKVRAIIETAPQDNPVRIQALNLYNQLQREADALSNEGYTARGRKARLDLKNTYNSVIPRILIAEEALRKRRNEYAEFRNSGQYIMANASNNPFTHTWSDYIDGQIPEYTTGIEKAKVYKAGKDASTLISARVVSEPTFTNKGSFTAITTEHGLHYTNAAEMMKNPDIATAVQDITDSYTQGSGWTPEAKEAVRQEVIRGAYEGLVHKTSTQYQRNIIPKEGNSNLELERRYTQDGNIAFINPRTGKIVRTETPEGRVVSTVVDRKKKNDSQEYVKKLLGSEAIPIGDVRFASRVAEREDYLDPDGKLTTAQLINNYGDTSLRRTEQVRLANGTETQNALKNLIKDVHKNYNVSGIKNEADIIDYINNNYIVMIEGGAGLGSQDNHVYAVPIQQAVNELLKNTDYEAARSKIKDFRNQHPKGSNAYEAFDDAYKQVAIWDYTSKLSNILKKAKQEEILYKITLEDILANEDLTSLGLSEQELSVAIYQLDRESQAILETLLEKEKKKKSDKKDNKGKIVASIDPTATTPATMN